MSALLKKRDFDGWPIELAAGLEGHKRTKPEQALAKVTGMQAGEPDLRVYLPEGKLGLIEMKGAHGSLSPVQKERHARLRKLGHRVVTIHASTPEEAVTKALQQVGLWLGV